MTISETTTELRTSGRAIRATGNVAYALKRSTTPTRAPKNSDRSSTFGASQGRCVAFELPNWGAHFILHEASARGTLSTHDGRAGNTFSYRPRMEKST